MKTSTIVRACAGAFAGLLLLLQALHAQPVRDKILGDVKITEGPKYAVIQVGFNFPVRYVSHFPLESGNELRIKLAPIAISPEDKEALFQRESVRPPTNKVVGLLEVIYEGDMNDGPFLTLLFRDPVGFKVEQGADFRSLTIVAGSAEASGPPIRHQTPGCSTPGHDADH